MRSPHSEEYADRGGRTGERDLVNPGVPDQDLRRLTIGRDDVEHSLGSPTCSAAAAITRTLHPVLRATP